MTEKRDGYSFDGDLLPIVSGEEILPNFEPMEIAAIVNNIAALGHSLFPKWGWAKIGSNTHKQWAQYFLTPMAMGNVSSGRFDGGGYVFIYGGRSPIVGTFAICRHEKIDSPDADHRRGWHPGYCRKCGLGMTYDSSD